MAAEGDGPFCRLWREEGDEAPVWDRWKSSQIWEASVHSAATIDLHLANVTYRPLLATIGNPAPGAVVTFSLAYGSNYERVHLVGDLRACVCREGTSKSASSNPLPLHTASKLGLSEDACTLFLRSDADKVLMKRVGQCFWGGVAEAKYAGFRTEVTSLLKADTRVSPASVEALEQVWASLPAEYAGPLPRHKWLTTRGLWDSFLSSVDKTAWFRALSTALSNASQVRAVVSVRTA